MDRIETKEKNEETLLEKCIRIVMETDTRDITYTTYDLDRVSSIKQRIAENFKSELK